MSRIPSHIIDDLKAAGHHFAAGAVACQTGRDRNYGCHFGFVSDRNQAIDAFHAGYDAAKKEKTK